MPAAVLIAVTAALAGLGFLDVTQEFREYDDEGYLLQTFRSFNDGAALYTETFTQYGPVYYLALGPLLELTGIPVDHDTGRMVTLVLWAAASLCLGLAAHHATRSMAIALMVQISSFMVLASVTNEPIHPGALLSLVVALAFLAATHGPSARLAAAVGALAAVAALTKINVGGLLIIGALAGWATSTPARGAAWVVTLLPFALMAKNLDEGWAIKYALVVAGGFAAVLLAARSLPRVGPGRTLIPACVTGFALAGLAVCAVYLAIHPDPAALVRGVLLDPLRMPDTFTVPLDFGTGSLVLAALLVVAMAGLARARGDTAERARPLVSLALGTCFVVVPAVTTIGTGHVRPDLLALMSLTAWWVVFMHPHGRVSPHVRVALASIAVLQALHAYPVGGSQIAWSMALFIPLGGIALGDGVTAVDQSRVRTWVVAGLLVAVVGAAASRGAELVSQRNTRVALDLPGADLIRVGQELKRPLRAIVGAIRRECDVLHTYPGMTSLNLFSGVRTPTGLNPTASPWLLDRAQQQRIVAALADARRPCIVRNRALLDFWARGRPLPQGPLARAADGGRMLDRAGDYVLLRVGA